MRNFILATFFILYGLSNYAQNLKFGKVSKEELATTVYNLDSTANAAFLFKKRKTGFNYVQDKGFIVETEVHERIKIYNTEGFDWGTLEIQLYKSGNDNEKVLGLKAVTYSLEKGKVVKSSLEKSQVFLEELNKYRLVKKFTMPNLSEGCIIEWKYKLVSPFNSIDDIQFQHEIPVKKAIVEIEIPEYYVFKKRSKGYFFSAHKTESVNAQIVLNYKNREHSQYTSKTSYSTQSVDYKIVKDIYDVDNIPALIEEPYVSNIENYLSGIEYELSAIQWPNQPVEFFSKTWEDVTKTIYKDSDFSTQIYKSNHFDEELNSILANAKTDSEKIVTIFEFVKSKIKWNGYNGYTPDNGTKKAYKEGVGNAADINLNLISMLNFAGFKVNPVLVSTRSNGIPIFPTISGFNFVIAAVNLNGGNVLLDATNEFSSPNVMPLRNLNWNGRIIRKDGSSSEINLVPADHSSKISNVTININENGEVEGYFRKKYTKLEALKYRDKYASIKDEVIVTKIENENKGIEIDDFKIIDKKNCYKPVVESCKFYSESMLDVVGDKIYIKPLLFNSLNSNPFKLDKRDYPVDFGSPKAEVVSMQIIIPDDYTVTSFPKQLGIGLPNNYGVYVFKVSVNGNKLIVQSQLKINSATIPSANYKELKDFYNLIINKNSEFIVIEKKEATP